jgi:hypothetical protein
VDIWNPLLTAKATKVHEGKQTQERNCCKKNTG